MSTATYFRQQPQAAPKNVSDDYSSLRNHLTQVYGSLALGLLACAIGIILVANIQISPILTFIGQVIGIAVVYLTASSYTKLFGLTLTGFCMGGNIAPLVSLVYNEIDPQ